MVFTKTTSAEKRFHQTLSCDKFKVDFLNLNYILIITSRGIKATNLLSQI